MTSEGFIYSVPYVEIGLGNPKYSIAFRFKKISNNEQVSRSASIDLNSPYLMSSMMNSLPVAARCGGNLDNADIRA